MPFGILEQRDELDSSPDAGRLCGSGVSVHGRVSDAGAASGPLYRQSAGHLLQPVCAGVAGAKPA